MLIFGTSGRRAILASVLPYLRGLSIRLYNMPHVPTVNDTAADYPEPTFDGYSLRAMPALPSPIVNPNDYGESDAPGVDWIVGPLGGSDDIYGYWLADSAGRFIGAEEFASGPVSMRMPGATCPVALHFLLGPLA